MPNHFKLSLSKECSPDNIKKIKDNIGKKIRQYKKLTDLDIQITDSCPPIISSNKQIKLADYFDFINQILQKRKIAGVNWDEINFFINTNSAEVMTQLGNHSKAQIKRAISYHLKKITGIEVKRNKKNEPLIFTSATFDAATTIIKLNELKKGIQRIQQHEVQASFAIKNNRVEIIDLGGLSFKTTCYQLNQLCKKTTDIKMTKENGVIYFSSDVREAKDILEIVNSWKNPVQENDSPPMNAQSNTLNSFNNSVSSSSTKRKQDQTLCMDVVDEIDEIIITANKKSKHWDYFKPVDNTVRTLTTISNNAMNKIKNTLQKEPEKTFSHKEEANKENFSSDNSTAGVLAELFPDVLNFQ